MNIIRAFGIEVRRRRLEAGWSIQALADRAGISDIYLGKVERGEGAAGAGLMVVGKIADALRTAPGRLLSHSVRLTAEAHDLAEEFMTLSGEQRRTVLKLVKALTRKGGRS